MFGKAGITNSVATFITNKPTPVLSEFFAAILTRN
jgi:hypothetical protein